MWNNVKSIEIENIIVENINDEKHFELNYKVNFKNGEEKIVTKNSVITKDKIMPDIQSIEEMVDMLNFYLV